MRFVRVVNFERFQHYKDRSPTWIKLYNSLLDDYAFACLQDASKLHLVMIWLLASRHENRVPADPQWIGRRINATDTVDLTALISSGFLEEYDSDSVSLAEWYGSDSNLLSQPAQVGTNPPPPAPPLLSPYNPLSTPTPPPTPPPPHPRNAGEAVSGKPSRKKTAGDYQLGFDKFWLEWPTHVRKTNRVGCARRWKRGELEAVAEQVIAGLRRWKVSQDWLKDAGKFIPAPLVWLNQERWKVPAAAFAEQVSEGNGFVRVERSDAEWDAMLLEGT